MIINNKIKKIVQNALTEDRVAFDKTTAIVVPKEKKGKASILANQGGIICGVDLVKFIFQKIDRELTINFLVKDGDKLSKNQKVALISGSLRSILKGERVSLNFLSSLSGIATSTNLFLKKAKKYKVTIKDTRKTTPGLRILEKYAVSIAGGKNHRSNLSEGILIKDNHLKAIGAINSKGRLEHKQFSRLWRKLRKKTRMPIEIEVETPNEFKDVARYKPDVIMLDNFTKANLEKVAKYRDKNFPEIELEASGGVTLENLEAIASTGIDSISVGSLTHSRKALDFSLEINEAYP